MSAEVETCSPVDPGLTAGSFSGAQGDNDPEEDQKKQRGSENRPSEHDHRPKELKENKENEEGSSGSADSAVQVVKKKVVEAPPPKVNPWMKRSANKIPPNKIISSSQETGKYSIVCTLRQVGAEQYGTECPPALMIINIYSFNHFNVFKCDSNVISELFGSFFWPHPPLSAPSAPRVDRFFFS